MNGQSVSFDQFAEFLRDGAGIWRMNSIVPESLFENDRGITEDDGSELLAATEKRFGIRLSSAEYRYRVTFHLGANEFRFDSGSIGPRLSNPTS
jgi:hypothetical protein